MMKLSFSFSILLICIATFSCQENNSQSATLLSPIDFSEKIKQTPGAIIMDVRSPEEFAEGHLPDAINVSWNGDDFDDHGSRMDKYRPVFVYCQGGGRSSSAAKKMRSIGLVEVYELNRGLSDWEIAKLPLIKN